MDRWVRVSTCALLVLAGCNGSDNDDGREGAPTTAAPTTTAPSPTTSEASRTDLTWTGGGFAGLEWGADRASTIAALSDLLGPPSTDAPGECGQYAEWRDPTVLVAFADDGRFGSIHFNLADYPHASGATAGDPIGALQSAETGGAWNVFGTNGSTASPGSQRWTLQVGDVVTLGTAAGPAPDGRLEQPVSQYSTSHTAPPCGD